MQTSIAMHACIFTALPLAPQKTLVHKHCLTRFEEPTNLPLESIDTSNHQYEQREFIRQKHEQPTGIVVAICNAAQGVGAQP